MLESYVHVCWLWLALPLVMAILAIVVFILIRWQSHRWDIPIWRSKCAGDDDAWGRSSRGPGNVVDAPPAEGVGGFSGGDGNEKISELEDWAEKLEVRLRRRGMKGLAFGLVRCSWTTNVTPLPGKH